MTEGPWRFSSTAAADDPLSVIGQEVLACGKNQQELLLMVPKEALLVGHKLITECLIYIFPLSLRFISGLFILHLTTSVGSSVIFLSCLLLFFSFTLRTTLEA